MKGKGGIITNLVILATGIVLIALNNKADILSGIIVITGCAFVIPSVLNMAILLFRESRKNKGVEQSRASMISGMLASLGGLALGTWMILFPDTLVGLLVYLFAALLLAGGVYHLYMLLFGLRPLKFPFWMYLFPALLIITGVVLFGTDIKTIEAHIVLIAGIAMTVFACASFLAMSGSQWFGKRGGDSLPEDTDTL